MTVTNIGFISEEMKKGRHLKGRWGIAQSGQIAKEGTVEHWEHWNGSVDANVRLRPFKMRLKPETANDPKVVGLVRDLELAVRAHEATLRTTDLVAQRMTAMRVEDVRKRLTERIS
jgi:hypothetical protein